MSERKPTPTVHVYTSWVSGTYFYQTSFAYSVILTHSHSHTPFTRCCYVTVAICKAEGDPLGGYGVTPLGYAHLTRALQCHVPSAGGRVVLALEGGYNLDSISNSCAMCVRALLGEELDPLVLTTPPNALAARTLEDVYEMHRRYLLKDEDA